ncbi:hypothetical protein MRX96_045692 [Rhipicephalus microplus]
MLSSGIMLAQELVATTPESTLKHSRYPRSAQTCCNHQTSALPPLAQEQGLKLAEEVPDGYQPGVGIELFFGAYCYWDITTGSVKRSNVRLVATENVVWIGAAGHRNNIVCLNAT